MARETLPCIACGRELRNVADDSGTNQPYNGTAFTTHGHYGSTAFDPMNGHYLEINVCDACLVLQHERVMIGRDSKPIMEEGSVVGWEPVNWKLVKWWPKKESIDYVLECTIKENGIYPVDEDMADKSHDEF